MPYHIPDFDSISLTQQARTLPPPSYAKEGSYLLRSSLADFKVDEVPIYMPNGEGEHIFIHLKKHGISTPTLLKRFKSLGLKERDLGFAGRKDERGITSQWISLPFSKIKDEAKRRVIALEQLSPVNGHPPTYLSDRQKTEVLALGTALCLGETVDILQVTRHPRKLRLGHLAGNRFQLGVKLIGLSARAILPELQERAETLVRQGFPNYFGDQRFGFKGDSLRQATAFMRREKMPSRKRNEGFLVSVWQSALFNHWLNNRVTDGLLQQALQGDVLYKEPKGAHFLCTDPQADTQRILAREISPSGPMWGREMRATTHESMTRESRSCLEQGIEPATCTSHPALKQGTRRKARTLPLGVQLTVADEKLQLNFTLPPGSYATVFVNELLGIAGKDAPIEPSKENQKIAL